MKFAFIILGSFDARTDRASIHGGMAQIVGVSSIEEACSVARDLCASGVDCVELCGAFGEAGARRVIAATEGRVPVGYAVHVPEQDSLYAKVFGSEEH